MLSIKLQSFLWTCDAPVIYDQAFLFRRRFWHSEEAVRGWDKFITIWKRDKKPLWVYFEVDLRIPIGWCRCFRHICAFRVLPAQRLLTHEHTEPINPAEPLTPTCLYACMCKAKRSNRSYPAVSPVLDSPQWWHWQWPVGVCWSPRREPIEWGLPTTALRLDTPLQIEIQIQIESWPTLPLGAKMSTFYG